MATTTVANVLVEGLRRMGTPRVFGVPGGGSSLDLMDAARDAGLPFVLTHGETAACIMAAVTGELVGAPGAALAGLGPGAASAVNGVAHAWLDRSPMLLFTDRHPAGALAYATHQAFDHGAMLAPLTKATLTVEPGSASHWIAHAGQLAMAEPRGPVHLDIAADVAGRACVPVATAVRRAPLPAPTREALDAAAELLVRAQRPVIVAGLQCRGHQASKWLRAFAEARPAPVLVTYKAKGVLPDPHPLMLGVFTGGVLEEAVTARADLIVAVGLDPVELIPRAWSAKAPVLHLAPSTSTSRYFDPALEVVGDIEVILEELAPRLRDRDRADWDVAELDHLKRDVLARLAAPGAGKGLAPHRVVEIARELTPAGTVATVDSGAHMFAATNFWQAVSPAEFLISNGLATMGFALPAAIAAQLVYPDRHVLAFTGDGGFMMAVAELETAVREHLPIVVVVFDDGALSLIKIKQDQRATGTLPLAYAGPDLVALAKSFGALAFVADTEAALRRAIVDAVAAGRPAVVDARIDASGYQAMMEVIRGVPKSRV
jgi:acetolactate synthase-1/2/3 large subunit